MKEFHELQRLALPAVDWRLFEKLKSLILMREMRLLLCVAMPCEVIFCRAQSV